MSICRVQPKRLIFTRHYHHSTTNEKGSDMPIPYDALKRRAAANRQRRCSTPGCTNHRNWTYSRCRACVQKVRRNGTATAQYTHDSKIQPYREHAGTILDQFAETPQVEAALTAMELFLTEPETFAAQAGASNLRTQRFPRNTWSVVGHHVRRVVADGLTAREAVDRIAGVWLYSHAHPRSLPDDAALTHVLAETIFNSRPYRKRIIRGKTAKGYTTKPKRPGRPALFSLGTALRAKFGVFLSGLAKHVDIRHRQQWELGEAMRKPLDDPDAESSP
ncbi:MAG: hypothetical protein GC162_12640 [Planctomycetes bacterium]|nr:hypothetical protein [Planctomycetota bacterium]